MSGHARQSLERTDDDDRADGVACMRGRVNALGVRVGAAGARARTGVGWARKDASCARGASSLPRSEEGGRGGAWRVVDMRQRGVGLGA